MKTVIRHILPYALFLFMLLSSVLIFCFNMKKAAGNIQPGGRKTLVIDPGHGGIDSGALSAGGCKESGINLSIALATRDIGSFFGVKTVMTRTDDNSRTDVSNYSEHDELVFRAETANSTVNAALLSIHQNTYPTGQPSGAQVIYASNAVSEAWGKHTHANLVSALDPTNRRVPVPGKDDFLLLSAAKCPALLVECGFMSNFSEIEKLMDHSYQLKLSVVLLASFLQFDFDLI